MLLNRTVSRFSIEPIKSSLGSLWVIGTFFVAALLLLSLSRIGLLTWQADRVEQFSDFLLILFNGVRVDISSLCYLFALPILLNLLLFVANKGIWLFRPFLCLWCFSAFSLLIYLEAMTPAFINEYGLRPNRLLVEYLKYPNEVFSMLWTGYKTEILFTSIALIASMYFATRLFNSGWLTTSSLSLRMRALVALLVLVACLLGGRSSLGHRPLNPAMVSFTTDQLLNGLALNSAYSLAFAIKQMGLENSAAKFYGDLPKRQIIDLVRSSTLHQATDFSNEKHPTRYQFQPSHTGKPKNLVILLQESLGARFVGGLGGLPLTPNLDNLMQQGWNFTNLYATGTRSVRGIEAVVSGFTPTPSRAVVKLDKSQRDFFTIASLLAEQNYHTQFVYGGESHFDNMKSFFLGNGFQQIVDMNDFAKVDFEGSWGASDEDLYDQAHLEFERLQQEQDKPFFSLVFTSSNHSPFEFPDGKIALYDDYKHTRNNAAKYSDYALGRFISKAKNSSYWQDTVFIVIADHDSRVIGAKNFPLDRFRIPGVIFGEGIAARQDNRLVSQIDIPTTLLSLIGASGQVPMLGHDLTSNIPLVKQRALMQYDKSFAYMTQTSMTLLQPQLKPKGFRFVNGELIPEELSEKQVKSALAHALFGSVAYQKQWYQ